MKFLFLVLILITPVFVFAHPGRTAGDGCHYCRTNCAKWGEVEGARHCHGGSSLPVPTRTPPAPVETSNSDTVITIKKDVVETKPPVKNTANTNNTYKPTPIEDEESGTGATLGVLALLVAGGVGLYRKFK